MVGALIGMRYAVLRHGRSRGRIVVTALAGTIGLVLAGGTVVLGVLDYPAAGGAIDMTSGLFLVWALGWIVVPVLYGRGGGATLSPQVLALLPASRRRLALGLLTAQLATAPSILTALACTGLIANAAAGGLGVAAVALVGAGLTLAMVVTLSTVVTGGLATVLTSRRGRDIGVILLVLVGSFSWLLRSPARSLLPELATGHAPVLSAVVRWLPTGWAAVAVEAAGHGRWWLVLLALAGLGVLVLALGAVWTSLLSHRMTMGAGNGASAGQAPRRRCAVPSSPLRAVLGKELLLWRREVFRVLSVLMMLIGGVWFVAVPALAPYAGLLVAVVGCLTSANLYGYDGSGCWPVLLAPDGPRVDVRGRQYAWLIVAGPLAVVLTVIGLWAHGPAPALAFSALPALLGAGAGVLTLLSVFAAYPIPNLRSGITFSANRQRSPVGLLAMVAGLVLLVVAPLPAAAVALVLHSAARWAALPVGLASGIFLAWWLGRLAQRRLAARGPELLATVART
jgi:ABC-2 type transport system permease protein